MSAPLITDTQSKLVEVSKENDLLKTQLDELSRQLSSAKELIKRLSQLIAADMRTEAYDEINDWRKENP